MSTFFESSPPDTHARTHKPAKQQHTQKCMATCSVIHRKIVLRTLLAKLIFMSTVKVHVLLWDYFSRHANCVLFAKVFPHYRHNYGLF